MTIGLYIGDICKAPAEVVCTSTNPHLDLMLGTGGAIREAGGWSIQEECNAVIARTRAAHQRAFLHPGSVARTAAGKLPFRAVVHCVAIDAFHDSTQQVITSCVRGALAEAAALNPPATTIAMPAFASGNGHYEFSKSLEHMIEAIQNAPHKVDRVWIIIKDARKRSEAMTVLERRVGPVEVSEAP